MGEVQAPYYTHSNLTLFPKLEDWIFFIKLSLLFTHSRGPLALGTKRSRRGGGREEKKQKEKNGLIVGCEAGIILVWGGEWDVLFCRCPSVKKKKGALGLAFSFLNRHPISHFFSLSLSRSHVSVCCVPASGLEPLTTLGLWCSPTVLWPPLTFWLVDSRQGGWSIVGLEQGWKQAGQQKGTYTQSLACASSSSLNGLLWPHCEPHC